MTDDDWEGVIDLSRRMWFDLEEIPNAEAQRLAATIDTRLMMRQTTNGVVVIDPVSDEIVGVLMYRGSVWPPKRVQGWHEVAIAKALARGDEIGGEVARGLHNFEEEMRRYLELFEQTRIRDYDGAITLLLLDPAYQGQGIGRQMMDRALQALRSQGVGWVYLDTDDSLDYQFYDHLGWRRVVEFPSSFEIFGKVYSPTEYTYEYQL